MNVTILAANGQIAHLVEERLLTEPTFKDIQLTLMLRHPERLSELNDNPRVTLLDGDLTNPTDVIQATKDADLINIGRKSRDFSHGMDRLLLTSFRA
ncbi:NAD(P)H-binding protein, partial [Limosilactobacillus fermentum]